MRQCLREAFERGKKLAAEMNFDYAHELFNQCVMKDPNNVTFVEAMLANLRAKFNGDKKKVPFVLGLGSGRSLKRAISREDWQEARRLGIEQLKFDPWHVPTLRKLADVCAALHHNEVELVYLKQALNAKPRDADVNQHCAQSLARMGQFDQAIACWHRIEIIHPRDKEAARMISHLASEKLKYPNGRPPVSHIAEMSPVVNAKSETAKPEIVVLSPRQKLEQAIAQDKTNVANYLELAALLLTSNQFNAAEVILNRATVACGKRLELLHELDRVHFLLAQQRRELAQEQAIERELESETTQIPWLELGLGFCAVILVLQLVPSVGSAVLRTADPRQWSQNGWLFFNVIIVLGLIGTRYRSAIGAFVQRQRPRRKARLSHNRA
jgi:tetratricopeptide (TPR) repeat protein